MVKLVGNCIFHVALGTLSILFWMVRGTLEWEACLPCQMFWRCTARRYHGCQGPCSANRVTVPIPTTTISGGRGNCVPHSFRFGEVTGGNTVGEGISCLSCEGSYRWRGCLWRQGGWPRCRQASGIPCPWASGIFVSDCGFIPRSTSTLNVHRKSSNPAFPSFRLYSLRMMHVLVCQNELGERVPEIEA